MLFYNRINTPKWRVAIFVLVVHFVAITLGIRGSNEKPLSKKPTQPLLVKTVALGPQIKKSAPKVEKSKPVEEPKVEKSKPIEEPKVEPKPVEPKVEKPKPVDEPAVEKPKPVEPKVEKPKVVEEPKPKKKPKKDPAPKEQPKQKEKPKEVKKQPAPKPNPKTQEPKSKKDSISSKQKEALAKLKQNIEKMDKKEHKSSGDVRVSSVPQMSCSLQVDLTSEDSDSGDLISAVLKREVRLPEKGEITFLLMLAKSGTVEKVQIEKSGKSQRNKDYVQSRVPKLKFPGIKAETTLTITLSGES